MDICEPLESVPGGRFDLVFSHNAFEHFHEPFIAAENITKLIKPGGLLMVSTVFAYHQHMSPSDYFRYTDEGLKYIFTKYGFETLECGYDVSRRRRMKTGGRVPKSAPLIDWMGGWLERWFVYYIGLMPAAQKQSGDETP
jgi:SAM-dependent methyltransferase